MHASRVTPHVRRLWPVLLVLVAFAFFQREAQAARTGQVATQPACAPSWSWQSFPDMGPEPRITALSASSPADAWLLGTSWSEVSFLLHWDGTAWQQIVEPVGVLAVAVVALSPRDVWIVGAKFAHWDGAAWTIVAAPTGATALAAVSHDDVWAVGDGSYLHWDGSNWSAVSFPGGASLFPETLAALARNDVWAVGFDSSSASPLAEHWDGTAWTVVPTPEVTGDGVVGNSLDSVSAVAANDIWAVGNTLHQPDPESDPVSSPLSEHWDGTSWRVVPTPDSPHGWDTELRSVAAVSGGDVWAVGAGGAYGNFIVHWDGTLWARAVTSTPRNASWDAVTALPDGHAFAASPHALASLCEISVGASGITPRHAAHNLPGDTITFHFTDAGRVEDASPLHAFDSGFRPAGSSFTVRLSAAADYPVVDPLTGNRATVGVSIRAQPASGPPTTRFGVIWGYPPLGDVSDIQVQRPGTAVYRDWRDGQTLPSDSFTPDAGTGTYLFRARVRDPRNDASSGWSVARPINVVAG